MTKREFIDLFEKYDDDCEVTFYDSIAGQALEPIRISQDIVDDELTLYLEA